MISDHYGYELAAFFTPTADGGALRLEQQSIAGSIEGLQRELEIAISSTNGLTATFRHRKPLVIPQHAIQAPQRPEYLLAATRAEIDIPIIAGEEILAVFNAQSSQAGAFDDEAVKRLQTILANIAPVIQYHADDQQLQRNSGKIIHTLPGLPGLRPGEEL